MVLIAHASNTKVCCFEKQSADCKHSTSLAELLGICLLILKRLLPLALCRIAR